MNPPIRPASLSTTTASASSGSSTALLSDSGASSSSAGSNSCAFCRRSSVKRPLQTCTACKAVRYCNSSCQASDWPRHKQECIQIQARTLLKPHGVRMSFLFDFLAEECERDATRVLRRASHRDMTTYDVLKYTITRVTEKIVNPGRKDERFSGTSLIEYFDSHPDYRRHVKEIADVFVCHVHSYSFFGSLYEALHSHPGIDPENTFLWIDVACINEHEMRLDAAVPPVYPPTVHILIKKIGNLRVVLSPYHAPLPGSRAWCVWELYGAIKAGCTVDKAMSPEERARLKWGIETGETSHASILRMFESLNVERAESRNERDKVQILESLRRTGVIQVEAAIKNFLLQWYLEICDEAEGEARRAGDAMCLANVARCRGHLYSFVGHTLKALQCYKDELACRRRADPLANHFEMAYCLSNVGLCAMEERQLDLALEAQEAALRLQQRMWGADHVSVAVTENNIALVMQRQGRLEEALAKHRAAAQAFRELARRAREEGEAAVMDGDVATARAEARAASDALLLKAASALSNAGKALRLQDRLPEALQTYQEALAIQRAVFLTDAHHVALAVTLHNMAIVHKALGNASAARKLGSDALTTFERILGGQHEYTMVAKSKWKQQSKAGE